MESVPVKQKTRESEPPHYGVSLAACNSFLQHRRVNRIFDPDSEAMQESWLTLGLSLPSRKGLRELLQLVSVAWQIEEGPGGDVAILLPSGRVHFFADSGNPIVFGSDEDDYDDHEVVQIRRRPPSFPRLFKKQDPAFAAADLLPPFFLWVWACDVGKEGSKQYVVASLDDFWDWYITLEPSSRSFYEINRDGRRLCFHADLEFKLTFEENKVLDPLEMIATLKALITQMWLEDTGVALDQTEWTLDDSCSSRVMADRMSLSEEEMDEPKKKQSAPKVSFHLSHPFMVFQNWADHKDFCARLHKRAPQSLYAKYEMDGKTISKCFLDEKIYTPNRLYRLLYSTKAGEERYLLPYGDVSMLLLLRERWEQSLITIPRPFAVMHPPSEPTTTTTTHTSAKRIVQQREGVGGGKLIHLLSQVIEEHFHPESMRDVHLEGSGMCTFSMVNHKCDEICNDTHNNQVYAVADLKRRVFYAKCHADRARKGPDHPFPESLNEVSIVVDEELQPGGVGHLWMFPAGSSSSKLILGFARAVFGSKDGGGPSVADRIPPKGEGVVMYDSREFHYVIDLGVCGTDEGQLQLFINTETAVIRCAGGRSQCSSQGWRLERPSRSSTSRGSWNLSFLMPMSLMSESAVAIASGGGDQQVSLQEAFLAEPNFYVALGFKKECGTFELYDHRLSVIEGWAKTAQMNAAPQQRNEDGVYEFAARLQHKASIIRGILGKSSTEMAYRECLQIDPSFVYPLNLLPKGPLLILVAFWVHLAKRKGYKRVGDDFYIPTTSSDGIRIFYVPVPLDQLLTRVCSFDQTPNLCALMWSSRTTGDMERMLRDENHWPSLQPSKRYLGFRNVVYDLEENTTLTWEDARSHASVMPFNCIDVEFPVEMLELAKRNCPIVSVVADGDGKKVLFKVNGLWIETPLFDKPQKDQMFEGDVLYWYYALFGRMFHRVGKTDGDNWEICPSSQGAPGTFKSSTISILQSFVQPGQYGVIATKTEKRFPISAMEGKFMVFLTETGGCDLDKELLKQMTCGDPLTVAVKFKTASTLSNWDVPMWFAGNSFLSCKDTDGSLERRFAVFPHTRVLGRGQGDTGLVKKIIAEERALILIKCNTLYLAMKKAIHEPIDKMLPLLIRRATAEALMQNDSLRLFVSQMYVTVANARVLWSTIWDDYITWCRRTGNQAYAADPYSPEVQTMVNKMGAHFHVHKGQLWLMKIRARTKDDEPYRSVFEVKTMSQPNRKDKEEDEDEDEAGWISDEKEGEK
jgi:hypothetical protein